MARFNIGDRVKINITIGSIYDKTGTITGYAHGQYLDTGQFYSVPGWKVKLDNGENICINERYLNPVKEGER